MDQGLHVHLDFGEHHSQQPGPGQPFFKFFEDNMNNMFKILQVTLVSGCAGRNHVLLASNRR